jgi:GTPase Era involved in 16S rRNA processing
MVTYQQQKQQVLGLFQQAISLSQAQKQPDIQNNLVKAQQHLAEGKLFVVVCGEFKQGKSSLLNALLNEPGLFPVDIDITTNLVSTITYGKEEKITVVLGELGQEQIQKTITRKEIADYVTEQGNKKNAKKARMLIIESPNPVLKEGLVLVDTPGAGSLNKEHTAITYAFIPNADAILFVSDAITPLTTEELKFLEERIVPHCQNLIFPVTKIDTLDDETALIQGNREKLAQVLNRPGDQIPIVPVSSANKLRYLQSKNSIDLEDSNFEELEKELWGLIGEQRGQILLLSALTELSRAIIELKNPIQAELAAYQKTPEELQELKKQLQDSKEKLQTLLQNNSDWSTELSYDLQAIRKDLMFKYETGFLKIQDQCNTYLEDNRLLENPKEISSLLEADIDALISDLGKQLSQQAAEVYINLESLTGLTLGRHEVNSIEWERGELSQNIDKVKKAGLFNKAVNTVQKGNFSVPIGASVGGFLGGFVGGVAGTLIAGPLGTNFGVYLGGAIGGLVGGTATAKTTLNESLSQIKEKEKREISKYILPFLKQNQLNSKKAFEEMLSNLEKSMREEFRTQIKREKQDCDRTIKSLQDACNVSQTQITQKVKALQAPLQQLNQLEQKVEQLLKVTVEQPTVPSSPKPEVKSQTQTITVEAKEATKQPAAVGSDFGDWADE